MNQNTSKATSLSTLCSICHHLPPKYTCPRCTVRTCSLACVTKHKAQADCSGIRDPAAPLSKSALLTPAAFDQDFNFLSTVERLLLDTAGLHQGNKTKTANADETESNTTANARGGRRRSRRGVIQKTRDSRDAGQSAAWQHQVRQEKIHVILGPVGLTRESLNKSRRSYPDHHLLWTVEWIFDHGKDNRLVQLQDFVNHDNTILEALSLFGKKNQKRKPRKTGRKIVDKSSSRAPSPTYSISSLSSDSSDDSDADSSSTSATEFPFFCYLHKPCTSGSTPVLIPINAHQTFAQILRRRTIVDFPTIYVIDRAIDDSDLASGHEFSEKYELEATYLTRLLQEEKDLAILAAEAEKVGIKVDDHSRTVNGYLNNSSGPGSHESLVLAAATHDATSVNLPQKPQFLMQPNSRGRGSDYGSHRGNPSSRFGGMGGAHAFSIGPNAARRAAGYKRDRPNDDVEDGEVRGPKRGGPAFGRGRGRGRGGNTTGNFRGRGNNQNQQYSHYNCHQPQQQQPYQSRQYHSTLNYQNPHHQQQHQPQNQASNNSRQRLF